MKLRHPHHRQQGLTLLEILVALMIGLVVIIGTIQIYLGSSQTYRVQESLSRIQENGRYAMIVLHREIRMAGYTGCRPAPDQFFANVLNDPADNWWSDFTTLREFQQASLQGFAGAEVFPARDFGTDPGDRVADTEALIVIGGDGRSYSMVNHNPANDRFTLNSLQNLQVGDIILACDGNQISIAQVTNIGGNTFDHAAGGPAPGNCTNLLGGPDPAAVFAAGGDPNDIDTCAEAVEYAFRSDTVLSNLTPLAFYIGVSTSGDSRSLFRTRLTVVGGDAGTTTQELIEHVEDMRVLYGVDTGPPSGQIDDYVEAGTVADWRDVLSVRLDLLLASPPDTRVLDEPQTIRFPTEDSLVSGVTFTSNDGRLRQAFSTTIGLRNRLP